MLKVLLVDDETIICQMLEKLIDWKSKEMEIVGSAQSGDQAMDMIITMRPDIVITDVRMPGMDGLQLVERVKELGHKTDFIIMSGYKHFEYAYTALNLGVIYYLLKPINKDEVEETLDRIVKNRRETEAEANIHKELEQKVKDRNVHIRKHFLNDIINMSGMQSALKKPFGGGVENEFVNECFCAFFTKVDQSAIHNSESLLEAVDYNIEKVMDKQGWEYINSYVKSGVITIINYRQDNREKVKKALEEIHSECRKEVQKFRGFCVSIGVGQEKNSLQLVQESIKEAIEAIQCRLHTGTDKIIYYDAIRYKKVDIEKIMNADQMLVFGKEINSLDLEAILNHIERIARQLTGTENYSPVSLFALLEKIEKFCLRQFEANHISQDLLNEYNENIQFIFDNNFDERMLIYRYKEATRNFLMNVEKERQTHIQKPIRRAEQFIRENFSKAVTLNDVAEDIGISPAYLSTTFKKEKGISFSDYLTAFRMEQAKIMLKETDDPVLLIAEKSGYYDAKYFSKIFRKTVGLKPTEYRKLYS